MNNKGQTLVVFVILIPILFFIMTLIIDIGLISIEKRKISNNIKDAFEYYEDNKTKEDVLDKINKLLETNIDAAYMEVTVDDTDKYLNIRVVEKYKCIFIDIIDSAIVVKYKYDKEEKRIIKG